MSAKVLPHPEWKLIVDSLRDAPYGSGYSMKELSEIAVCPVGQRLTNQIQKAKMVLIENHHRALVWDKLGNVYRLIQPEQFHGRSRKLMNQGRKRVKLARKTLEAVPMEQLNPDDQRRIVNALAHVGAAETFLAERLKDTRPSLPLRPDVPRLPGVPKEKEV